MKHCEELLLDALRPALRGEKANWTEEPAEEDWRGFLRLAMDHHILPLTANAIYDCPALRASPGRQKLIRSMARRLCIRQAVRTAEFLLLTEALAARGLRPAVMKGIVCRSLYPEPELRESVDEDLLIDPREIREYHKAMSDLDYRPVNLRGPLEDADEVTYEKEDLRLTVELHTCPISADSEAYGDCSAAFDGAYERAVTSAFNGVEIRALAPTDHVLYLICHAYKHFLYSGVGIRQLCDLGLMTEKENAALDWARIVGTCEELRIAVFAAALFRICERQLGFSMPEAFAGIETDESDLLEDILSGGLYGVNDLDRAHSSTITLEAAAAGRSGRKSLGALRSLFPRAKDLESRYPYLQEKPWLLPAAWTQRAFRYLTKKYHAAPVSPAKSVQIGRRRTELFRKYGLID